MASEDLEYSLMGYFIMNLWAIIWAFVLLECGWIGQRWLLTKLFLFFPPENHSYHKSSTTVFNIDNNVPLSPNDFWWIMWH